MARAIDPPVRSLQIWFVDLAAAEGALHQIEDETRRLSEAERDRALRFSEAVVARRWVAAHIALRLILEHLVGGSVRRMPFVLTPRGKPTLPDAGVAFSLSHCEGYALIATAASGEVGVDIEAPRPVRMSSDRRRAIETAAASVSPAQLPEASDRRFLQAWVRLEALAKATGEGMGPLLSDAGAFGPSRKHHDEAAAQRRSLRPGFVACDLDLGPAFFAAVGTAGEDVTLPAVQHLPVSAAALRAFAGGEDGR